MDNHDYYEITSQLDAREVLRYLNNLGIHNISGEVLKYFITDLKKLIKYNLQHSQENEKRYETIGPERLHSASTFSSRSRSKVEEGETRCSRECQQVRRPLTTRLTHSAPNIAQEKTDKPPRRACSCVRVEKKETISKQPSKVPSSFNSNNNLIKVPKQQTKRKSDPVSLYHYYNNLWAKYKTNVPGENDWSELRWSIRQKMVGGVPSQNIAKVSERDGVPGRK